MKRYILSYITAIIITLLGGSCTDEISVQSPGTVSDKQAWVTLNFGHTDFEPMTINTRSTLGEVAESRVQDLYLYIFVDGKCVYNYYFGDDSQKASAAEVNNADNEQCWYVQNRTSETNAENSNHDTTNDTHGAIHIRAPQLTGGTLYLIANANAHVVNISPDKLSTIQTEAELKALTATLQGDVVTRYGYFPMVEVLENISVGTDGIKQEGYTTVTAHLERLDAKISVNVKAATDYQYEYNGSTQTVKEFTPESWSVINVPKGAFVIDQEGVDDSSNGYFDYLERGFETTAESTWDNSTATTQHGFSFYMLENRYTATGINDFHQRDLRSKNSDGTYTTNGNIWANAPQNSTYLIIKGYLSMDVTETDQNTKELGADVTYYIHLGDFSEEDYNNFQIKRNTHHTYNITIKGVKSIEVEVETSQPGKEFKENQPGAMGNIYVSQQSSQLFDAHYAQYVTSLHVANLDTTAMAWYVQTPFGTVGSPQLNGEAQSGDSDYESKLGNYDYKWVWFMINPTTDNDSYETTSQWYPGDGWKTNGDSLKHSPDSHKHLMNVDEFVSYIKKQYKAFHANEDHTFKNSMLYFTVFIDEYYYESHPITGDTRTDLWKEFVNDCGNRLMHILCNSNKSKDGDSSSTNSVITIRQRPIQTPYNITKESLKTAWGCEIVDETNEQLTFYPNNAKPTFNHTVTNTSQDNGLYNTACMWGMINGSTFNATEQWNTYVNPTTTYGMTSEKESVLYSPLVRNRDNNGNGTIEADEVRWYIASLGQLYGLFMGQLGLKSDAYLYPMERASQPGNSWKLHVTSSTSNSNGEYPIYVWAEEALSTGTAGTSIIRCVRNLGMDSNNIANRDNMPESLIKVIKPTTSETLTDSTTVRFDLTNINVKSLRTQPSTVELDAGDEFSDMSCLYYGFETGKKTDNEGSGYPQDYLTIIKNPLDNGTQFSEDGGGWRVPNIREGALMSLYCSSDNEDTRDWAGIWWGGAYTRVSTYWSLGTYGTIVKNNGQSTWKFTHKFGTTGNGAGGAGFHIRLVRDVHPSTF